jgi:hypothetical protein
MILKPPKTKKYFFIGDKKILINRDLRGAVVKAMESQRLKATKERVDEWIKNF